MSIYTNWFELNLTRLARTGSLDRAVEVDEALLELTNTIDAGLNAIVVGDSGIGKSALIYELAARSVQNLGPRRLRNRKILQISLRRRLSTLAQRYEIHAEVQKFFKALKELRQPPALFIRDAQLIYDLDLEDEFSALAFSEDIILLGEMSEESVSTLFRYEAALRGRFGLVRLAEPDLDRSMKMVRSWCRRQKAIDFDNAAVEQAVTLSHRFLVQSALPRKAIDLLKRASCELDGGRLVTSQSVIERLSSQFRIPRLLIDREVKLDLRQLELQLNRSVVGQPEAVSSIVDTIAVVKAGLTDVRKPLAALLFAGPTGVGKTLIAQTIATELFGQPDRMIRFNMADFQTEVDALRLFGCSEQKDEDAKRGQLAMRIVGQTLGVLLLDEFEKCHPSIHDRFLQLIDEGEFVNGTGQRVSCRSFMIIVTTNAGHARHDAQRLGFCGGKSNQDRATETLSRYFRFELLNRFDRVVLFRTLSEKDARGIVVAELKRMQSRMGLRELGLTLEIQRRALDLLVTRGYHAQYGARHLRRTIEQDVSTAIARLLLQGEKPDRRRIRLVQVGDTIQACFIAVPGRSSETNVRLTRSATVESNQRCLVPA